MTLTIADFATKTGIKKNTLYLWISENRLPKGVRLDHIGKLKLLKVSKQFEHFDKLK